MAMVNRKIKAAPITGLLMLLAFSGSAVSASSDLKLSSRGQTVYVPAYSHIYHGNKEYPFYVAATLSVRNTDLAHAITIHEVNYYDSQGKILKRWLEKPVVVGPQSSEEYMVKESDKSGGFGAHFLVRWKSDRDVSPPLMESVIIGTSGQQGISFTTRGQVVKEEH